MNNNIKSFLWFTTGAIIGALAMHLYWEKRHNQFIEEEAEWCERTAEEIIKNGEEAATKQNIPEPIIVNTTKDEYMKMANMYSKQVIPFSQKSVEVITFQDFCENPDFANYEKITLNYYAGDDTLADMDDEEIEPRDMAIGNEALSRFGTVGDSDVVYVRNHKLRIDYEIVWNEGSYSNVVLGERGDD